MSWDRGQSVNGGKYIIQSELGRGAFGITYKALHKAIEMPVVIKTPNLQMRKDRQYPRYIEKFKSEAKLLGRMCANPHPHIVRVTDFFEEEQEGQNLPCLVMEFVAGESLYHTVEDKGALPESQAIERISQVGEALAFMHQADIVHRDAHPGNIMLRDNAQAILIDFGLAGEILPKVGTSKHFASRFAPYEQMQGVRLPTVDIYCLAATLYYAVTGEYPVTALDRKYHGVELEAPTQYARISQQLNSAILVGMEIEAVNRPPSMREWLKLFGGKIDTDDLSSEIGGKLDTDDLSSERGIDYTCLRDLLKGQEWREADLETRNVMLKCAGREKEGWLDVEQIQNFPCADLRTINALWVKYSNGRFGFSVQKQIWRSCGGKVDDETECKLGDRVGWRRDGEWLGYNDLTFNLNSPSGHLPVAGVVRFGLIWTKLVGWLVLLSRPDV